MKYLIVVISLFIATNSNAQAEDANFLLKNFEISWQKVYDAKMTKEEIITYFKASDKFWLIEVVNDTIFTKLKPQKIDPAKTGVAGVPVIVNKTSFKGLVIIELKEKKYRVTLKNIVLIGDGELLKKGEEQTFEQNYLNKELIAYRPFFLKGPKEIYNLHFNNIFEIEVKAKEEW